MIHGGERRGLMLVISSPSGAGKTSLAKRLRADYPELDLSISCTTRSPRPGEEDGREYHFVSRADFDHMVEARAFLEWAEVHEHRYGSPTKPAMASLAAGRDVLFDIDWQGAKQVKASAPDDVVSVFILPPSMAELRRRLYARAADDPAVIERRLGRAWGEISQWPQYDYVILNDDIDGAYTQLVHIYQAERLRRPRNAWIGPFVDKLKDEPL
ncbi:MAG TPA: guanylate kinase [Caulobacteraceae bacterium]|jgi:guanylate kinase